MYSEVSAAVMRFIGRKSQSFPNAVRSKKLFMEVPAWKRAMIFVRMTRHVLEKHASKHWNNYGYENYKFNKKVFKRWMEVDFEVIRSSPNWANLDAVVPAVYNMPKPKKRKRTTSGIAFSSPDEKRTVHLDCTISDSEDED